MLALLLKRASSVERHASDSPRVVTGTTGLPYTFQYLTAWARVTLPHRKALLNNEIEVKLWDWCEDRVEDNEWTNTRTVSTE
jgi:hypothetical protein